MAPEVLPPLVFRAAAAHEPCEDLRHPVFNNRTIPLLLTAEWQENYGKACACRCLWLSDSPGVGWPLTSQPLTRLLQVTPWATAPPGCMPTCMPRAPAGQGMWRWWCRHRTAWACAPTGRSWCVPSSPHTPSSPSPSELCISGVLWRRLLLLPHCTPQACCAPLPCCCSFSDRGAAINSSGGSEGLGRCFSQVLVCAGSPELEALNISQARRGWCVESPSTEARWLPVLPSVVSAAASGQIPACTRALAGGAAPSSPQRAPASPAHRLPRLRRQHAGPAVPARAVLDPQPYARHAPGETSRLAGTGPERQQQGGHQQLPHPAFTVQLHLGAPLPAGAQHGRPTEAVQCVEPHRSTHRPPLCRGLRDV